MIQMTSLKCIALKRMMTFEAFSGNVEVVLGVCLPKLSCCEWSWLLPWRVLLSLLVLALVCWFESMQSIESFVISTLTLAAWCRNKDPRTCRSCTWILLTKADCCREWSWLLRWWLLLSLLVLLVLALVCWFESTQLIYSVFCEFHFHSDFGSMMQKQGPSDLWCRSCTWILLTKADCCRVWSWLLRWWVLLSLLVLALACWFETIAAWCRNKDPRICSVEVVLGFCSWLLPWRVLLSLLVLALVCWFESMQLIACFVNSTLTLAAWCRNKDPRTCGVEVVLGFCLPKLTAAVCGRGYCADGFCFLCWCCLLRAGLNQSHRFVDSVFCEFHFHSDFGSMMQKQGPSDF